MKRMSLSELISKLQAIKDRHDDGFLSVEASVDWLGRDRNESKQGIVFDVIVTRQGNQKVVLIQADSA